MGEDAGPREQFSASGLIGVGILLLLLGGVVSVAFANTALQGPGIVAAAAGVILLVIWLVIVLRARRVAKSVDSAASVQTGSMALGTPATVALTSAGIAFTPHPYHHDPANRDFGAEAASMLGVEPGRVFKTLIADVDGRLVVAIVPITGSLDLGALAAAAAGKRAAMADPAVAQRKTGYVVGGISPIGQKTALATVLDETAELFDTVFVSGGKRGFDIELAPADLIGITGATVAAIAKER
jgi:Cys-tRNA(Pro)/Cys-tRNA(Cys) deacylase